LQDNEITEIERLIWLNAIIAIKTII
jgi:hypothetical protein